MSSLGFESDGLLDFVVLEGDQGVGEVTVGVVLGNNLFSALITALVDQPTRRLGDEPDEEELDDGGERLKGGGNAPGPAAGDTESTESGPSCNDGAREPKGVVQRGERSTMGRVGNLRDQKRRGHLSESGTETDQETSADEHAEILSGSLKDSSEQDDGGSDDDTSLAAQDIGNIGGHRNSTEGTNRLNGVEKTEIFVRRFIEILKRESPGRGQGQAPREGRFEEQDSRLSIV